MIVKQNASIIDRIEHLREAYCIYEHWIFDDLQQSDICIYVGMCRLHEVYTMPDAYRNSMWIQMANDGLTLTVKIIMTGTYEECANERARIVFGGTNRPVCNVQGTDMGGVSTAIICNETNIRYSSQIEAARALGCAQSQLSGHLARKTGFKRVKGFTFRRG